MAERYCVPDVVALAHALGGVVALPEDAQHLLVARLGRVEHHQHGLGVAGAAAADLLVGGVGREAAGVADGGGPDALGLPELALRAPEAAHAEHGLLEALGEGRRERVAEHEMALGTAIACSRPGSARSGSIIFVFSRDRKATRTW